MLYEGLASWDISSSTGHTRRTWRSKYATSNLKARLNDLEADPRLSKASAEMEIRSKDLAHS